MWHVASKKLLAWQPILFFVMIRLALCTYPGYCTKYYQYMPVISSIFCDAVDLARVCLVPRYLSPSPSAIPHPPRLARCLRAADSESLAELSMGRAHCCLALHVIIQIIIWPFCSFVVFRQKKVDEKYCPV